MLSWSVLWVAALTVFGACQPCFTGATVDTDRPLLMRTWGGRVTLFTPDRDADGTHAIRLNLPDSHTPIAIWKRTLIFWNGETRKLAISSAPNDTVWLPLEKILPDATHLQTFCPAPNGIYLNVASGSYHRSDPYGVLFLALPSRKLSWMQGVLEVRTNATGTAYAARDRANQLCVFDERGETALCSDERHLIRSWDFDPATERLAYVADDHVTVLDRNGEKILQRGIVGVMMRLNGVRLPPEPRHPIWLIQERVAHSHGAMELSENGQERGWRYVTISSDMPEFIQSLDPDTFKWLSLYLSAGNR